MTFKNLIDTELEVALFAIFGVVFLETIALLKGMDGIMFGAAMTALGVIIGWVCKTFHFRKK